MDVKVSICCAVYNDENYLEKTLESFVMQETDFAFEILIHDDASTDRSSNIIAYYKRLYPNLVTVIRQKKNQASKGIPIEETFLIPKAKGKYIALCEGKDYWIDAKKLQKQVDFMESHPECSLCLHDAIKTREDDKTLGSFRTDTVNRFLSTDELIQKEQVFSPNTLFFLKRHLTPIPKILLQAPVGEYPLIIWLSLNGKVYYMNDALSAYRLISKKKVTKHLLEKPELLYQHSKKTEKWLLEVDAYTNQAYSQSIKQHIKNNRLALAQFIFELKAEHSNELRQLYKHISYTEKVKLNLAYYFS